MTVWPALRRASLVLLGAAALLALSVTPPAISAGVGALLVLTATGALLGRHARRTRNFHAWVRAERAALRALHDHPERWAWLAADDADRLLTDLTLSAERGEATLDEVRETYTAYRQRRLPAVPAPAAPPF